jgi:aspartyl-tRNA(Asn)/glutamyl-tRNA(Gln) amidotransferase subunit B
VRRAHLEEDTGKLTHLGDGTSLVDYNRAGVPLLEIVSEPDIHSAEEAEAYARRLRALLRYLGVNHGDMSKGVLRFEANVSVMHRDDTEFRTRREIKNLNSIRSMVRAIEEEVAWQIKTYESGGKVGAATLGWDEANGRIVVQRYKERADEYRYFPEPDLPILVMEPTKVDAVRAKLPELPDAKKQRFMADLGLSEYDARQLSSERAVADFYEAALAAGADAKPAANWILVSLFSLFNKDGVEREAIATTRVRPAQLADLVKMVSGSALNKGSAEKVLAAMWETGDDPAAIVAREGLAQVSDTGAIGEAVAAVLAENADMVRDYLGGKDKLFGALMGQAMRRLGGKGNAQVVTDALKEQLEAMRES